MNVHDWTRVDDGTFHHFHGAWIFALARALNRGVLPPDYYAMGEQHASRKSGDVLTLHAGPPDSTPPAPTGDRAVALAEAPPRVSRIQALKAPPLHRGRTLTVRHSGGDRIVALVEVVSRSNKASSTGRTVFVDKVTAALRTGIHCAILDVLPPGKHDPRGMHGLVVDELGVEDVPPPSDKPFSFVSYAADPDGDPTAYLQHFAVGDPVPSIPLFLTPEYYVQLPLADSYEEAFEEMPARWREVIECPA